MPFSLLPFSRTECINDIEIDKTRFASIDLDVELRLFGFLVKKRLIRCYCMHVDARTKNLFSAEKVMSKRRKHTIFQTLDEMRKHKFRHYDQLLAMRLRKHIQRLRESNYAA